MWLGCLDWLEQLQGEWKVNGEEQMKCSSFFSCKVGGRVDRKKEKL